jgi:hypothetical protein
MQGDVRGVFSRCLIPSESRQPQSDWAGNISPEVFTLGSAGLDTLDHIKRLFQLP